MTATQTDDTILALLSAPQVVAAVLRAVRTGGPEAAGQVGRDIEAIIDPCAAVSGPWGCWEVADTFDHWPGPLTAAHQNWTTTCTA